MLRPQKTESIEKIKRLVAENPNVFLIHFSKINVGSITTLRQRIREKNARYLVAKNTLIARALEGTGMEGLKDHLKGPTAIVVNHGDPVEVAKVLTEFAKDNPDFGFKAGYVEQRHADAVMLKSLATMPSKQELIAKLLYLLQSPIQRLVFALHSPPQKLVQALNAISDKK
jgi:large subunit ribosomal protein L10